MGRNENNIINKHDMMWYDTIRKGQKMFRVGHNRNLDSCDGEKIGNN